MRRGCVQNSLGTSLGMRDMISERLLSLCDAATEIIENQQEHAVTAAIEEVARRLKYVSTRKSEGSEQENAMLTTKR